MGNTFGNTLHLTIFGESHGTAIGCVIDGLPAGIAIDWDKVSFEMRRRAPGSSPLATPRKEKDEFEILSGYFDGHTEGDSNSSDRKSTRLNSSHTDISRMPSSA